ncbi:hypothetical protein TVAG_025770 [Trichomonas vaginalis G3]|uniref:Uncharacterized protein n=1 Tax=Trichomonas vaginalis (strain ATCC PRA-98 / G3) TaxID=412133 RepID=A2F0J9_TRIV3|nr:expressed protein family [Trichomonas vaginalis G3]EAY01579.1 hypothetical protein TVAG_025770 [Trichomonas vaginalis G3]KAI5529806.1 expressed protein family [Trichomonas vaginalis G3]|eukprot:XP_001314220.1 hypothetical protein [Trichomonas vaginalis G3]
MTLRIPIPETLKEGNVKLSVYVKDDSNQKSNEITFNFNLIDDRTKPTPEEKPPVPEPEKQDPSSSSSAKNADKEEEEIAPENQYNGTGKKGNAGLIAGVVVGVLAVIIIAAVIVVLIIKKKNKDAQESDRAEEDEIEMEETQTQVSEVETATVDNPLYSTGLTNPGEIDVFDDGFEESDSGNKV